MVKSLHLGLVVVVGLCATSALAQSTGKLSKASGQVFVRPPSGAEAAATQGAQLIAGTNVRTGLDGSAEVTFDDGSVLRLAPNSSIALSAAKRQQKKSSVLLFFGKLWNKVVPSKTGDTSYEVSTANAVCGVRGTEFEAEVADDGSLRMQVSEGKVAVSDDGDAEQLAGAGQQVEATDAGVEATEPVAGQPTAEKWQSERKERLRTKGAAIVKNAKERVMARKAKLEALQAKKQELEAKRKDATARAKGGDKQAVAEVRELNKQLQAVADEIADIGDEAFTQLGFVDHVAVLAQDPRFKMLNKKTIAADAKALMRVKESLDRMVAEGTDLSIESMDKMLDDMSKGKPTLKEKKGSTTDELFGDDPMDMR